MFRLNQRVNNFVLRDISLKCEVSEWSHLDPLLFKIFIKAILNNIFCGTNLLFADDPKLFSKIAFSTDIL